MLRSSVGTFRALLETHTITSGQRTLQAGGRQLWKRTLTSQVSSNAALAQPRPGAARPLRNLGQIFQRPTQLPRMGQSKPPFRSSRRTFHSSRVRRTTQASQEPAAPQSLSQRMRKLSREYGWAGVGVYLGLSVLDFPFCFLLVRALGTDRVAEAEHFVVSHVQKIIPARVRESLHEYWGAFKKAESDELGNNEISKDVELAGWGVKEADERNKSEASLATQLALAYAIHKSFIFVRVPLTAAVTPKVVKVLRSWGWQIGKRRPKR